MRRLLPLIVPLLGLPLLLAENPAISTPKSIVPNIQEVIFYTETKPIRVFVHINAKTGSLDKTFESKLKEFFKFLDRDGDGFLSPSEAEFVFSNTAIQSLISNGYAYASPNDPSRTFDKFDKNKDGKISLEEFIRYYEPSGQYLITSRNLNLGDAYAEEVTKEFFNRLNSKKDGRLTREELAVLPSWIPLMDRDEDDCLSVTEIIPDIFTRNLASKNEKSAFGAVRVHPVGEFSETAIENLMLRYDANRNLRLKPNEIAFDAETFKKLDKNGDGMLSMFELMEWRNLPPELEIEMSLGANPRESSVRVLKRPDGRDYPLAKNVQILSTGNLLVKIGNQSIDFGYLFTPQPTISAPKVEDTNNLLSAFNKAANGRDFVVDKDLINPEYQHLRILFDMADRNGDNKVTREEIEALVKLFVSFKECPVQLAFNVDMPSIFRILDQNQDGRLSLRELRQAWKQLHPLEPSGEDYITSNISKPQAKIYLTRENDVVRFVNANPYQVSLAGSGQGPIWFQRLDRNADGDISLKEFPGSKAEFDRLDLDGDGLISLEEAETAEKRFRRK